MKKQNKKRLWIFGSIIGFLLLIHITLPFFLVFYVNKTLKEVPGYTGSVEWIHVNLFRGAYTIHDIELLEKNNEDVSPFFSAKQIDLSIEWKALFKGKIAGEIILETPNLVFQADADSSETETDTTSVADVDWTKPIKDLMPLEINRFEINNGQIHYVNSFSEPKVDIYFSELNALVSNLTNAEAKEGELPSPFEITAKSIGNGTLKVDGGLNIIKKTPDFDINLSFENVDLTELNDFLLVYAKADVSKGTFNFYTEVAARDGQLNGYLKPLLTDLKFVDWQQDKKKPLKLLWESVLGFVAEITENQAKDQFATKVPISGNFTDLKTGILPSIANIFRNAFFKAFENKVDNTIEGLQQNEEKNKDKKNGLFGLFKKDEKQ